MQPEWVPATEEETYKLNSVLGKPVKDLEEEQQPEHQNEVGVEVVSKNGHGQTRLNDCLSDAEVQALHLSEAQRAKEQPLDGLACNKHSREEHVSQRL